MLTDSGKSSLSFFCHSVPVVTAAKAINEATIPIVGRPSPTSNPKTNRVPQKPKKIPIHCRQVTTSFKTGPANIAVRIGCKQTIKAVIPTGKPFDIE